MYNSYNYLKTSSGTWSVEIPLKTRYNQIGSHNQVEYDPNDNTPIKYKEVARLAKQLTGKRRYWNDDKFLLIGIKNILEGK
jgi:hypothetical protein